MLAYGTITISDEMRGSGIYKITTAPSSYTTTTGGFTPTYRIALSTVKSQAGVTEVLIGDILEYSYYHYPVGYVDGSYVYLGPRVSFRGATGASATAYSLIVSHAAIVKAEDGTFTPDEITLTAKSQTGTAAMANYTGRLVIETTTDNSTWTNRYNQDAATYTYTIPSGIVAVRCSLYVAGGTATLLDQQIVPVVSDGASGGKGEDAYTVILTNENHTFAGGTSAALAGSTTCNVVAYKGSTQVAATIGTISGAPTGMSTTITSNGTTSAYFTVTVTTSMATKNGVLTVPVTVDGKSFSMKFSYSLALAGTSVTISSITYATSTTETQPADSAFTATTAPTVAEGNWLWTKVTFSSGNSVYTKSKQGKSGTNGTNGTSYYTHIRYSVNSNGNPMVTTPTDATLYIGIYTGTASSAPTGYTSYTWSRYTGKDGVSVTNVTSTNNTQDGGTSVITVTLSDGTTKTFNVKNGSKGSTGDTAQWFYGTVLTHTSGTATTTVTGAVVGSMYLNTDTSLVYKCTAISGSTMTWTYAGDLTTGVIDNITVGGRNYYVVADSENGYLNETGGVNSYEVEDSTPYIFRRTGDGKSNIGDHELDEIVGASVVFNQLAKNNASTITQSGVTITNNGDGTFNISGTATGNITFNANASGNFTLGAGHKYFVSGCPSGGSASTYYSGIGGLAIEFGGGAIWANSNYTVGYPTFSIRNGTTVNFTKVSFIISDLTVMFGSTVADALYNMGDDGIKLFRSWYPSTYYPYTEATMEHVSGLEAHEMVGFNAFDASTAIGNSSINASGAVVSGAHTVSDFIKVLPSTEYYVLNVVASTNGRGVVVYDADKTFIRIISPNGSYSATSGTVTTPTNAMYMRVMTDSPKSCNVNLSDPTRNGTYKPYEKHSYALDASLTLRGLIKYDATKGFYVHGDTYAPDGTVTRKYGIVDLGTLNWVSNGTDSVYVAVPLKKVGSRNVICDKLTYSTEQSIGRVPYNGLRTYDTGNGIAVKISGITVSNATTMLSGMTLVYELATPTTETAIAYASKQKCDDYGTEEYVTTGLAPVGHNTQYATPEYTSDYIEVTPGETIIFQAWITRPTLWMAYCFYDANKVLVGSRVVETSTTDKYKGLTIEVPSTAYYMRVSSKIYDTGQVDVERGNVATEWSIAPEDIEAAISTAQTTADNALTSANGKNKVYHQDSQPSGGTYIAGDTWFDTDDGYKMYTYNGSSWVAETFGTNALSDLAVTNAKIANGTIQNAKIATVDAGKITTGTLDAARIGAGSIAIGKLDTSTQTSIANGDAAKTAIDNLDVGGRNLARNTGAMTASDWVLQRANVANSVLTMTPTGSSSANAKYKIDYLPYGIYKNNEFTISFDCRELETGSYGTGPVRVCFMVQIASRVNSLVGSGSDRYQTFNLDSQGTDWHRYSITKKIPDDITLGQESALVDSSYVSFQFVRNASTRPIEIKNIKLELGNVATDWTVAPEDVDEAISTIDTKATDAAKTATNYITYIDSTNGIRVYDGQTINQNQNFSQLNSNGMQVYKSNNQVASFGDVTVLGSASKMRAELDYHSYQLIDKEGDTYFYVSDLRDDTGYATLTYNFVGDGTTTYYRLNLTVSWSIVSATIDGVATTDYIQDALGITFDSAPASGSEIIVVAKTANQDTKAYTFGSRNSSGNIGRMSMTEGVDNTASGWVSKAEGYSNVASGDMSHAEGYKTTSSSGCSHAEGYQTVASGGNSYEDIAAHAQNIGTIASSKAQTALGKYNVADAEGSNAVIIGNGTDDSHRSDLLDISWGGNILINDVYSCVSKSATDIQQNADLDDYMTPGVYYSSSDVTPTLTNGPLASVHYSTLSNPNFSLCVISGGNTLTSKSRLQIAWSRAAHCIMARSYGGGGWTEWATIGVDVKPIFTVNISNARNVSNGYNNLTYANGMVIGTLRVTTAKQFAASTTYTIGTISPYPIIDSVVFVRSGATFNIEGWISSGNGALGVQSGTAIASGAALDVLFIYKPA